MTSPARACAVRGAQMLQTALGPSIAAWLDDDDIVEIMLNPDGRLWLDRLGYGLVDTGCDVAPPDGERIIRLVAHHVALGVHEGAPRLSAELPGRGERFEGVLPPLAAAPCFSIRKPAAKVWRLDRYVSDGVMSPAAADLLAEAVRQRRNIIVAGPTSSGKTTLANALLAEVAEQDERVVILEDLPELQCPARNRVTLRTRDGVASLRDLVRTTLRLRPDRIVVGEVRGAEALDLVKAWGTGHPGGLTTLHADTAIGALRRLEQLIEEAVPAAPRALIADCVDLVVVLRGRGRERHLWQMTRVDGQDAEGAYRLVDLLSASQGRAA